LKKKEEKYLKELLLMRRKLEFYESNSANHPQDITGDIEFKTAADINLMAMHVNKNDKYIQ
jgi:hypothetical protein